MKLGELMLSEVQGNNDVLLLTCMPDENRHELLFKYFF